MQQQTSYQLKPGSHPLQSAINTLLLNASFIDNIGLMHGKMGISIFFFHLSRQTKNKIYEEYAGELIDEIYEDITNSTPVDFENGLTGLGWGIEYLVQNGFIEADTDEVLEDFDDRISKELIYNPPGETGLLTGILGIGAYFIKRLQNPLSTEEKSTTLAKKQTLEHILDMLDKRTQKTDELIKEPISRHPSQPQTHKPQTTNDIIFDIIWDYPALLWFLAEVHKQTIFNYKLGKLLPRLIEPLSKDTNLPGLHSNRLLIALTLSKLQQTINFQQKTTNKNHLYIDTIISNLLKEIDRNTINTELIPNDATLRYGSCGIAWIYRQLHRLGRGNRFKQETEHWIDRVLLTQDDNRINQKINAGSSNSFGILEGMAGALLLKIE
jgi:hypothetical protein